MIAGAPLQIVRWLLTRRRAPLPPLAQERLAQFDLYPHGQRSVLAVPQKRARVAGSTGRMSQRSHTSNDRSKR